MKTFIMEVEDCIYAERRKMFLMLFVIAVLNCFDLGLTTMILNGGGSEANLLMDGVIQRFGMMGVFLSKLGAICVAFGVFFTFINERWQHKIDEDTIRRIKIYVAFALFAYAGVVLYSIGLLGLMWTI